MDEELLIVAETLAQNSPDIHEKVGAVIMHHSRSECVGGFNRFPDRVPLTIDRLQRPAKYLRMLHAEQTAIFGALQTGYPLKGSTLYSTRIPCASTCCLLIAEVGITKVISSGEFSMNNPKWAQEYPLILEILSEADVELVLKNQPGQGWKQ
jgi:dCMP deaminase